MRQEWNETAWSQEQRPQHGTEQGAEIEPGRASAPPFPALAGEIEVDVAIVGGGLTGITAAYHLAAAGRRVAVLERRRIGSGETRQTTAFLTEVFDTSLHVLRGSFGDDGARDVWKAGQSAIDDIEQIVRRERIDCGFTRCPAFVHAPDEPGREELETEHRVATELGLGGTWETSLPFLSHGCLRFERQARFHPLRYLHALAARAERAGAAIFEASPVESWDTGGVVTLKTNAGSVRAAHVLFATHTPLGKMVSVQTRLKPAQTYVLEGHIPPGRVPGGIYWNTNEPYEYFRIDPLDETRDRIILGGSDHPTGQAPESDPFVHLEEYARGLLPGLSLNVVRRWSGEIFVSTDGVPFIGSLPGEDNLYLATGFAGNGVTFSNVAARLFRDAVLGMEHPWHDRIGIGRVQKLARAAGAVASMAKTLVKDRLGGGGEKISIADIPRGEGAVIRQDGKKAAVHVDAGGAVTILSPVCTHMGCDVQWNSLGQSWDCPCHGSRFHPDGSVRHGPATAPLEPGQL